MDHRRTPARKALTLPAWVIVSSALICLGAAVLYAALALGGSDAKNASARTVAKATATSPAPTTPAATTPTATATSQPAPAPTSAPAPKAATRHTPVVVLNNTRTPGLARSYAAKVTAAGWSVVGTGNWRGSIPSTTVYYPPALRAQADLLAKDLHVGRVRPAVSPMKSDQLTLILSGPQ